MSDKLKQGVAVIPSFNDGQSPTAHQINALGAQLRRAAAELEKAVGDLHGQSWPYVPTSTSRLSLAWGRRPMLSGALSGTEERSLDIANLARLIGPSSNLNPRFLAPRRVSEAVPVGVHEFSLRYPISGALAPSEPDFSDTTVFAAFKANVVNLLSPGDYHVTEGGKVYTVSATNGGTAEYDINPRQWRGGTNYQDARFNVIPDPNQVSAAGAGLAFGSPDSQGRYPVTLPVTTHQQSNYSGNSVTLGSSDPNTNIQQRLPKVLEDNLDPGDLIPAGFLYLKNVTTNEIYSDAEYFYNGISAILIGNVNLDDEISSGHDFVLLTVGTDITSSIDDLRAKLYHSHNRRFGEPFVTLSGISGFLEEAGNRGSFVPSTIPGNFAPQYFHRDGFDPDVDSNQNDNNVLRGDIMLGYEDGTPGDFWTAGTPATARNSHSIRFGHSAVRIRRNQAGGLSYTGAPVGSSIAHIFAGGPFRIIDGDATVENNLNVDGDITSLQTITAEDYDYGSTKQQRVRLPLAPFGQIAGTVAGANDGGFPTIACSTDNWEFALPLNPHAPNALLSDIHITVYSASASGNTTLEASVGRLLAVGGTSWTNVATESDTVNLPSAASRVNLSFQPNIVVNVDGSWFYRLRLRHISGVSSIVVIGVTLVFDIDNVQTALKIS